MNQRQETRVRARQGNRDSGEAKDEPSESSWLGMSGVKADEEVDALGLYLFADSEEGREAARGIDRVVSEMPGLEGLTLLEDAVDEAVARARSRPGWGGTAVQSSNGTSATARPVTAAG